MVFSRELGEATAKAVSSVDEFRTAIKISALMDALSYIVASNVPEKEIEEHINRHINTLRHNIKMMQQVEQAG